MEIDPLDPRTYMLRRAYDLWPNLTAEQAANFYANSSEFRRKVTRDDPLAFALYYMDHHLRRKPHEDDEDLDVIEGDRDMEHEGSITMSEFHYDLVEIAKTWVKSNGLRQGRECVIGPRKIGKSTWSFLILPMWAAAHGHLKFVAAFSDTADMAEGHLRTFKTELDNNEKLRADFFDLCSPAMRRNGTKLSDKQSLLITKSGFNFAAKGVGTGSLGLKVGHLRPDLLILDDIEPAEEDYSAYEAEKRLIGLEDKILPLNETARVMITGTVTMTGSLIHQLVLAGKGHAPEPWIKNQRIKTHYWPAILENDDGTRRSIWPSRWPLQYLESIEHTRDYAKNFANMPVPLNSDYWLPEHFIIGDLNTVTREVLAIDPAVTKKRTSDQTAFAVVGFSPSEKKAVVREVRAVRERGKELRDIALGLLQEHPNVRAIVIEINQGGELWLEVFHDMPVPIVTFSSSEAKEVRAARLLNHYQRGRVLHAKHLYALESQMQEFPNALHDDLVDVTGHAIDHLTLVRKPSRATVRTA